MRAYVAPDPEESASIPEKVLLAAILENAVANLFDFSIAKAHRDTLLWFKDRIPKTSESFFTYAEVRSALDLSDARLKLLALLVRESEICHDQYLQEGKKSGVGSSKLVKIHGRYFRKEDPAAQWTGGTIGCVRRRVT